MADGGSPALYGKSIKQERSRCHAETHSRQPATQRIVNKQPSARRFEIPFDQNRQWHLSANVMRSFYTPVAGCLRMDLSMNLAIIQ